MRKESQVGCLRRGPDSFPGQNLESEDCRASLQVARAPWEQWEELISMSLLGGKSLDLRGYLDRLS